MAEFLDEVEILRLANTIEDVGVHCALPTEISLAKPGEEGESVGLFVFTKRAKDLTVDQKNRMFEVLKANVQALFEKSTWGWHEAERHKELFHAMSRYVIVSKSPDFSQLVENMVGFASYRFDWDDDDEPEHPVLYLYELQVVEGHRSLGIGEHLMGMLKTIAEKTTMWKILLTCFKYNTGAMKFYKRVGFGIDHNSPSQCGYHGESYEILSDKPTLR